jgi:5-methylcytosine-specific restriction endonuclease McrA
MNATLVLNADYSPLGVAPLSALNWKEAIKLIYLSQVDVIEQYSDWFVHSPSVTMQVPSVVVSKTYVKSSRSVKFNKQNLCIRDNYTCQYCNQIFDIKSLTIEHVIPRCHGGKTTWTNVTMACSRCNTRKGHRLDVHPQRLPYKPSIGEIISKVKKQPVIVPNSNWIPYIGWSPSLVSVREPYKNIDKVVERQT